MKADRDDARVAAFAKRLLSFGATQGSPALTAGILFLLSEVIKSQPSLREALMRRASVDEGEEDTFDPSKREPSFAFGEDVLEMVEDEMEESEQPQQQQQQQQQQQGRRKKKGSDDDAGSDSEDEDDEAEEEGEEEEEGGEESEDESGSDAEEREIDEFADGLAEELMRSHGQGKVDFSDEDPDMEGWDEVEEGTENEEEGEEDEKRERKGGKEKGDDDAFLDDRRGGGGRRRRGGGG
eukprot:evm.model.NODE_31064_length_22544_cov_18.799192.2